MFVGEAARPWLRLLKPGFRHCFAALRQDGRWLLVDPLKRRLEIQLLPAATATATAAAADGDGLDLAAFFRAQGHRVLRGAPRHQGGAAPEEARGGGLPRPLTCVETVKRLVGVESAWTFTPWQLFRRLQRGCPPPFVETG